MPQGDMSDMIAATRIAIAYISSDELRARMRAVLAHLERTQWRPIEEAPFIFGSGADRLLTDGRRHWVACRIYIYGEKGWAADRNEDIKPTHFMFLDALPPSPETPR